jgi:hypothetical protein
VPAQDNALMTLRGRTREPHPATIAPRRARELTAQTRPAGKETRPHAATVRSSRAPHRAAAALDIARSRGATAQPAWSQIVKSGNPGGSGGGGKKWNPGPAIVPVKAAPKRTVTLTHAAKKHYGHHQSPALPTSDEELRAYVLSEWDNFQPTGNDREYALDLGDYNTRRTGGLWELREWRIVVRTGADENESVVIHYGPSS